VLSEDSYQPSAFSSQLVRTEAKIQSAQKVQSEISRQLVRTEDERPKTTKRLEQSAQINPIELVRGILNRQAFFELGLAHDPLRPLHVYPSQTAVWIQ